VKKEAAFLSRLKAGVSCRFFYDVPKPDRAAALPREADCIAGEIPVPFIDLFPQLLMETLPVLW